jgi:hypothetical protein
MVPKPQLSRSRRVLFSLVALCIPLVAFCLLYLGTVLYRSHGLYLYFKTSTRGWKGSVHRPDPLLGYAPIPNARGFHILPIGEPIPMRYGEHGFRVPVNDPPEQSLRRPTVLALGCSFTYGDAVVAESAYAYLVGEALHGTTLNAGVCGYGLGQMLVLAQKLIPATHPDYVLVQHSPWLADRSATLYAPAFFGRVPVPYFYATPVGFALHPPVFQTVATDLPAYEFRSSPVSLHDRISFFRRLALPLYVHDDFNALRCRLAMLAGFIPPPTTAIEKMTEFVYREIAAVAEANHARVVIVVLPSSYGPLRFPLAPLPRGTLVVNARDVLIDRLVASRPGEPEPPVPMSASTLEQLYRQRYAHWRGSPPQMVDPHPNEAAHRIIAEQIVAAIRADEGQ